MMSGRSCWSRSSAGLMALLLMRTTSAGTPTAVQLAGRFLSLGACADQDIAAQGGVALAGVLAGAAEGHAVVDGAVVSDLRRLAEDDAHAVVDEQAAADLRAGVDLDAC